MDNTFEYKEIYKYPLCVCLNLTDSCNLACKYCFVEQNPHYMDLNTAKKAVDYIVHNLQERKKLEPNEHHEKAHISFFGGEPTLMWDKIIKPIVNYTKENYNNLVDFNITTNGTLLNEERIKFLYDNQIYPLLSMDGNKDVQDYNRPMRNGDSSFEAVNNNIEILLKYFPNTTFRATIYQPTCGELFNSYLFAQEKGFNNIFFCPNAREQWTDENIEKLKTEIYKIITHRTMSYLENISPISCTIFDKCFIDILDTDLQIYNNYFKTLDITRVPERCGLGTTSFSIGYDGRLYICQEQDSRSNDFYAFGDIYNGVDVEKHKTILQQYFNKNTMKCENQHECLNCKIRPICIERTCPSVSYDLFNNFLTRPKIDCVFDQCLFDGCALMMNILVNDNNPLFKQYLNDLYSKQNGSENI